MKRRHDLLVSGDSRVVRSSTVPQPLDEQAGDRVAGKAASRKLAEPASRFPQGPYRTSSGPGTDVTEIVEAGPRTPATSAPESSCAHTSSSDGLRRRH
jgi:hypothetical protein